MSGKLDELEFENPELEFDTPELDFGSATKVAPQPERGGIGGFLNDAFNRVPAGIRSTLGGKGYMAGYNEPQNVPSIQNTMLDKYYGMVGQQAQKMPDRFQQQAHIGVSSLGGLGISAIGYGADIVTNPAELLTILGSGKALKMIAPTPVGKALGRFLNKPRKFLKFGRDAVLDTATKGVAGINKLDDIAGQKYEKSLLSIKGKTDKLKPISDAIIETKATFPDETFPMLTKVEDRLAATNSLDAVELRNLKQEIKRVIPKGVFKGVADATPQQAYQLRVYNAIDDALVDLGGDKYVGMKKDYSDWKTIAGDSYKALTEGGRPSDTRLRNWFGYGLPRREFKALEKASGMLPPKEQFMQDFLAWKRGQTAKGAAAGIGTYMLYRKLSGGR